MVSGGNHLGTGETIMPQGPGQRPWTENMLRTNHQGHDQSDLMAGGVALKVCLVSPPLRILRGKMMINDGILELSSSYFT